MKWTKLKQLIEARFAPELTGRIQIQTTRYRHAHDQEGEFWVTLDGAKIYGSAFYQHVKERTRLLKLNGQPSGNSSQVTQEEIEDMLDRQGISDHMALSKALFESLSQSLDIMLSSPSPLIRAIAVMDARFGKRRLEKFDVSEEHELVNIAFQLRNSSIERDMIPKRQIERAPSGIEVAP